MRESKALYDNLYLSRIIVGRNPENVEMVEAAKVFAKFLQEGAAKEIVPVLYMNATEAETENFSSTHTLYSA